MMDKGSKWMIGLALGALGGAALAVKKMKGCGCGNDGDAACSCGEACTGGRECTCGKEEALPAEGTEKACCLTELGEEEKTCPVCTFLQSASAVLCGLNVYLCLRKLMSEKEGNRD